MGANLVATTFQPLKAFSSKTKELAGLVEPGGGPASKAGGRVMGRTRKTEQSQGRTDWCWEVVGMTARLDTAVGSSHRTCYLAVLFQTQRIEVLLLLPCRLPSSANCLPT
jgi:hypothetical protein